MSFGAPELLVILMAVPIFSIWALIDALVRPDVAWQRSGQTKAVWAVVIALTIPLCFVGMVIALVYLIAIRPQVAAAQHGAGAG